MASAFLETLKGPLLTIDTLSVRLEPIQKQHGRDLALVTGATDGIGKALAGELAKRGFNVVIHGRHEQKLADVQQQLEKAYPERQFRTRRIGAGSETTNAAVFERAADEMKEIDLRMLINNVGGGGGSASFVPLQKRPTDEVQKIMDMNARFLIEMTKAQPPQLRRNQPSLIVNIGSTSSEFGIPYLGIYATCKAANKAWSTSLAAEMRAEGYDVEVLFGLFSSVSSENLKRAASLFVPTARQMATAVLDKARGGRRLVFGCWAHELQARFFWLLPTFVQELGRRSAWRMRRGRGRSLEPLPIGHSAAEAGVHR